MKRLLVNTVVGLIGFSQACVLSGKNQDQANRVPPGQRVIEDFPLLHISSVPDVNRKNWSLKITGEADRTIRMQWEDFMALEVVETVSDFHCVTGWTRLDNHWKGVRIRTVLQLAGPKESASYVTFISADGYATSLPMGECTGDDDILAFRWEGKDLEKDNGGPVRVVIPDKYGYKSALWIQELRITKEQELGYWEQRGYSNSADPWREERYKK